MLRCSSQLPMQPMTSRQGTSSFTGGNCTALAPSRFLVENNRFHDSQAATLGGGASAAVEERASLVCRHLGTWARSGASETAVRSVVVRPQHICRVHTNKDDSEDDEWE
jgi:hypothetical protein